MLLEQHWFHAQFVIYACASAVAIVPPTRRISPYTTKWSRGVVLSISHDTRSRSARNRTEAPSDCPSGARSGVNSLDIPPTRSSVCVQTSSHMSIFSHGNRHMAPFREPQHWVISIALPILSDRYPQLSCAPRFKTIMLRLLI